MIAKKMLGTGASVVALFCGLLFAVPQAQAHQVGSESHPNFVLPTYKDMIGSVKQNTKGLPPTMVAKSSHFVSWGDLAYQIWDWNWAGHCGYGSFYTCVKSSIYFNYQYAEGDHSRVVQGGFKENYLPNVWGSRWCTIKSRFYHLAEAVLFYKSC